MQVFDQPQYHILERSRVEYDFDVLYNKYNYGLTTWSPLASGVLTGKYSKGIPEGSRLSMPSYKKMLSNGLEEKIAKADKLAEVAKEVGCSLAQLAIAWVASSPHVSTVILGATSIKQLDENLKAMEFVDKITPEVREKIDAIADFKPKLVPQAEPHVINLRQKWL
jgi:aryl-alcohol dehydrogenase-like predicted oxidoreductase